MINMVYYGQILPIEQDPKYIENIEKNYIGIGGTCTIKTQDGQVDLADAVINMVTQTITGINPKEYELEYHPLYMENTVFKFEDITELIFEGFYINDNNRNRVIELDNSKAFKLTKIPRRN